MQIRRYGPTVKSRRAEGRMRPDSRTGRSRRRFFLLLPALALPLSLLAAGPAQAQSSDATLRGLRVEVSTDGTSFSSIGFIPKFSAGQTRYDTAVQPSYTHARLTPSASHSAATLQVGKAGSMRAVSSGSRSAAIALNTGSNFIVVKVTAEDGSVRDYTLNVTRGGRVFSSPPRNMQVSAGDASLTLTWDPPAYWGSFPAGGYDVDWHAGASSPTDERDWNRATRSVVPLAPTATSYKFTGTYEIQRTGGRHTVTNGTTYRLRLRAFGTNPDDSGDRLPSYWVTMSESPAAQTQSSNADLSGLTASTSTSSTGTFTALTLSPSTFSAGTTSYTATAANARTHAKVTPTVAHSAATVEWRKGNTGSFTSVSSGSASGAIALSVGANAITVRVTAQDGTTKDYTVTITREAAAQSSNADLSGLTASTSTSSTGTFTALTLSPSTFSAATTSYTATAANARTHAKVTPAVAHSAARVGWRKGNTGSFTSVSSGSASGAIALSVGANAITVRVTAQDGTTKDYTVTITREAAAATPTVSLSASPNPVTEGSSVTVTAALSRALTSNVTIPLTITDNSAEPADHGTLASITINSGATSGTGTITTNQDPDEDDETFTVALGSSLPSSVAAGTPSSVQIRITDDDRTSPTPVVSLSASPNPVTEGSPVTVTARLSSALSSNGGDPADAVERVGRAGRLRLAAEHYDQIRFDDRHGHDHDVTGHRRR